jgi:hypothetical protein
MAKLKEFIQIEDLNEIQDEIRELNEKLMDAMSQTDIVRELMEEKSNLMKQARDVSSMLIPEVRELNSFVGGESLSGSQLDITPPEEPMAIRGRGRPRKANVVTKSAPRIPKELEMSLPKNMRPVRSRGRPKKVVKEAPVTEVSERLNPLEELRKNLANLRDQ